MKKVAIVSCYFQHNYGSMLQAYATQMALDKLGYENETIDISGFNGEIKKAKMLYFAKASLTSDILLSKLGMAKTVLMRKISKNEYALNSHITLVVSVAKPVIGVIFVVLATDKVTARILGLALVELIGYSGLYISQMRRGKKFFSKKFWKYALCFNLPLVPHYLSQTVLSSADRIMISNMVGSDEAGIYSLAYSISLIMTLFNTALSQTLSPWIYQKIKDRKADEIHGIAYGTLGIIAAVNILLIAFAPEVVAIFAPESYYEAIWVIPPVAMSVFFMFAYDLFAKFAFYYEKTNFIMIASVIGAVLNIVLNYICIGMFGYVAAGYTTLLCYAVYVIAHYIFMNRVCDEKLDGLRPYSVRILLLITVVFLAAGFYFLLTYNHMIIRYLSLLVAAILLVIKKKDVMSIINKIMGVRKK